MRCLLLSLLCLIPSVSLGQEVFFSPRGGAQTAIVRAIDSANNEIRVATYVLTSVNVANALQRAHDRGVDVQIVADDSMNAPKCCARDLAKSLPVKFDHTHAIMHNKYIVIDRFKVVTGSYNFSGSAELRNAENLIVFNDADMAQKYLVDWLKHWGHSR